MPDHGVEDILGTVRVAVAAAMGPFGVAYEQAAAALAVTAGGGQKDGHAMTGSKEGIQDQGSKGGAKSGAKEGSKSGTSDQKVDHKASSSSSSSSRGKRPRSEMTADSAR